ncbi:hypothetical protein FM101_05465 [Arthrobacter rhombi]|uniref:Uncharacterized protein n=1 Tax=Arthrobacter rhombi TaxID=71253 RepID=A0A1R4FSA8_9MICC|nr:hypothetical protein FM101_05465 [Arthrobacter rhombi]
MLVGVGGLRGSGHGCSFGLGGASSSVAMEVPKKANRLLGLRHGSRSRSPEGGTACGCRADPTGLLEVIFSTVTRRGVCAECPRMLARDLGEQTHTRTR